MTPEQIAMMPAHEVPADVQNAELLRRVSDCVLLVQTIRFERMAKEYPPGHPERSKIPSIVREFELRHGLNLGHP